MNNEQNIRKCFLMICKQVRIQDAKSYAFEFIKHARGNGFSLIYVSVSSAFVKLFTRMKNSSCF